MRLNSLFQTCLYIVIIMTVFSLSVTLISSLGIFGSLDSGVSTDLENESSTFESISDITMNDFWSFLSSEEGLTSIIGLGATVGLAILTRSPTLIGVGLFSTVFWTSYMNVNGILSIGGYLPVELMVIGYIVMFFLWVGAVIGMITGSG